LEGIESQSGIMSRWTDRTYDFWMEQIEYEIKKNLQFSKSPKDLPQTGFRGKNTQTRLIDGERIDDVIMTEGTAQLIADIKLEHLKEIYCLNHYIDQMEYAAYKKTYTKINRF
jgi:hypothetical protein